MKGTDYVAGKVPSPAWRRPLALGGLLALALLLPPAARAQERPGETVRVAEVRVHGCKTVAPETVLNLLATRMGAEFSRTTLEKDLIKLAETKWFRPFQQPVRLQNTPDGRIIVDIFVEEHPNVVREILFKNAHHAKPEDLEPLMRIKRGSPLNPSENVRACYEIQDYYRKKGYLLASVYLEEGGKATDQRVVFNVSEGYKIKIRHIGFTGNDTLASQARLRTQIDSKQPLLQPWMLGFGMLFGEYVPGAIEHDAAKLADYYRGNGYLNARVTREVTLNADLRTVDITFHIDEGVRYRVQDVSLEGPKTQDRNEVQSVIRLKKGEQYSEPKVEADIRNITDWYGYRGYGVITDKKLIATDAPGLVHVRYEVMERGPHKVGEVKIINNTVTKDRVIRRVLQIYPGQILSYPLLKQGERDLARLGLFDVSPDKKPTVTVKEPDNPESDVRDVEVRVTEQPTGSLMFGLGVNSSSGLVGSIVLNERNFDLFKPPTSMDDLLNGRAFRGGGQEFRAEAVPGTQLQRYTVSFREPFLFDRPISFSASGYFYQRLYNEYTEERIGGRFTLGKQLNRFWSVTGTLRVEEVKVQNVAFGAPPDYTNVQGDHFLVGGRLGLVRDDRDSFLRPTEGGRLEAAVEGVTGDFTFPIVTMEGSQYFTTYQRPDGSGRHVLALHSQLAWASNQAPVYERFFAGGFNSLRGFQFRGVGPNVDGFMVGGDFLFLNTIEYQVPVKANDQLYLVAFLDHGTVEREISLHDYRVSAGFGIRITVPMLGPVPIAVDFGFPILRGAGDRTQLVAFYIGVFK